MVCFPTVRFRTVCLTLLALCIPAAITVTLPLPAVHARVQGENMETAAKSRLTGIPLDNALRLTGGSEMVAIRKQLDSALSQAGAKRGADEILFWISPAYTGPNSAAPIMETVAKRLKDAGYQYEAAEAESKDEDSSMIIASKGAETVYAGLWLKSDQLLMLAWCRVEKAASPRPDTAAQPDSPTPERVADTSKVLVPGEPVLTQRMVDQTGEFLAYLIDSPLNLEQKAKLTAAITSGWKKKEQDTIELVRDFIKFRAQIFPKPEAERDLIRKQLQPPLLKVLRENKNDEGAKWILGIYEATHKPIAPGKPPLTRQMTDAYTEVFYFMASEVIGEKITPNTAAKNAMAKGLSSGYTRASAAAKKQLNQMPVVWAAIRVTWPKLSQAEKQSYRDQWRKDLQTMLPAPKRTTAKSTGLKTGFTPSSNQDLRSRMAALQAMQSAYQARSNMMWQNHYSQMNTTNTWGGNPYRYVNSWGNPY